MALKIVTKVPIKSIKKTVLAKQAKQAKQPKVAEKKATTASKPASTPSMLVKTDADWRAEQDARTLVEAEEIKKDAARLRKAKSVAQKTAIASMQVAKL